MENMLSHSLASTSAAASVQHSIILQAISHSHNPSTVVSQPPPSSSTRLLGSSTLDCHDVAATIKRIGISMYAPAPFSFKSPQQFQICQLLFHQPPQDVLAVLPTGGGKTLPVFIRSLYLQRYDTNRFVIFIVPVRALLLKLYNEALNSFKINAKIASDLATFTVSDNEDVSLMIVSIEVATHSRFGDLLQQWNRSNRIDRLVIDECHLLLDQSLFRGRWADVAAIRSNVNSSSISFAPLQVGYFPLLLQSATCPPSMQSKLQTLFHTTFVSVRMSTVRPDIAYRVQFVTNRDNDDSSAELAEIRARLTDAASQFPQFQFKALIFVSTIPETVRIHRYLAETEPTLSAGIFHGQLSAEEAKASLFRYEENLLSTLIATDAAGVGTNFANVLISIHYGPPRSKAALLQQTGRIGRGSISDTIRSQGMCFTSWIILSKKLIADARELVNMFDKRVNDISCSCAVALEDVLNLIIPEVHQHALQMGIHSNAAPNDTVTFEFPPLNVSYV